MLDLPHTFADLDEAMDARTARGADTHEAPTALMQCVLHALDHQADGLAVVTEEGRIIYANPTAQRSFAEHNWLRSADTLGSSQIEEQTTWLKALRGACRHQTRSMVEMGTDLGSVFAAIAPMTVGARIFALVTLGRQEVCGTLELYMFAKRYSLSGTEREVLEKFCKGHKPQAIAHLQGVAVSTVVTQLAAIRAKSNCGDLRELLHKIACLPTLRPLVMGAGIH